MDFDQAKLIAARIECDKSLMYFTRLFFKELRGKKFTLNWHHEKIAKTLEKVKNYEALFCCLNIPPRHSKCIDPSTKIMTTKGLIKAEDLSFGDVVYTFDNGILSKEKCLGTELAYKMSVKITMNSGREIICSHDHPMLTTFGYVEAENISKGDRIKVVNTKTSGSYSVNNDELIFVTLMIFEGDCGGKNIRFSNQDENIVSLFYSACKNLEIGVKQYSSSKKCDHVVMGGASGKAAEILKKYGILGHKCYTKRIPFEWFELNMHQKLIFIDLMFATDGYIGTQNGRCGIALANKELINDIQHMLSTIGVISRIHYKPNNHANAWAIDISRLDTQKLCHLITFHHKRHNALKSFDKDAVHTTDSFPYEIITKEKLSYKTRRDGIRCEKTKEITRPKFYRLARKYPELEKYIDSDFYLDKVVSVESVGEKKLIHISVNRTKNFIANGLVSHNTEFALNFIAQGLGENPKGNYLYITSSDELRAESSVRIRDIVSSDLFKSMYGVELKKDQRARNLWRTTHGGGLKTATIFGQITGFGAGEMPSSDKDLIDYIRNFEGCIVLDDIDKILDAESGNANNKKTHDTIFNTILSRKNSMDTPIIMIQQRAGEEDSTSVLLEHFNKINPSKVIHLSLPVIYEGEPLWPDMMDMATIEGLKTSPRTAHVFETQYMQNPISPNDKPFHKTKLKYFTSAELPEIIKSSEGCLSYIDCKDEGNDYYCHVFGVLIGSILYIIDVIHNQHNTEITVPASISKIKETNCLYTLIETNSMGAMVFKQIKQSVESRVVGINSSANKNSRISFNEAFICGNMRFLSDPEMYSEYATYMDKLCKFEYGKTGKPDDAPDATAGLATWAMNKFPHLWK